MQPTSWDRGIWGNAADLSPRERQGQGRKENCYENRTDGSNCRCQSVDLGQVLSKPAQDECLTTMFLVSTVLARLRFMPRSPFGSPAVPVAAPAEPGSSHQDPEPFLINITTDETREARRNESDFRGQGIRGQAPGKTNSGR